jgi:membrane-bound lytic murein transglycosylase B
MTARRDRTRRGRARRATVVVVATLAAGALAAHPSPAAARTPGPTATPALPGPSTQAPPADPAAGPYDPGFVDAPLETNPPSPALADVPAESDELDDVEGDLVAAEGRRDDAIAHRDDLRQHIVELGEQRVEAVDALGRRQEEERLRGEERGAAVDEHERRIDDAEEAARRLEEARDDLRELMIAAYVGGASAKTDALTLLGTQDLDVDDPMLRLQYGGHAADGRVGDVRERVDAREEADAAEDRAAEDRATAEQAERDAVAAREAAEQAIVDIDAETVATQEDEVEAVADLADREADVLVAAADIAPARLRADVVGEGIDFPLVALDAWVKAAATAPCRMEWWVLAGISKVEGRHGTHGGGRLGARGYPSVKIIGPQLNGAGAFAAVGDTDGGRYDEDPVWDRAVGPMQFIPSTWARWGRDGDGDGTADPFTIYDATAGAAAYLCAGRTDLTDEAQLRAGYLSYNQSQVYVDTVLRAARGYQAALPDLPAHVVEPVAPPG